MYQIKFDAFFYIDDISDNFKIPLFDINKFDDNLRSGDILAFDNFSPIYRWPLYMTHVVSNS